MPRPSRIEGLDLIRGLAIALVMLRHGWSDEVGGAGIVGVVMFFALSGYLITGVLLGHVEQSGRPDFRRFYRDRAVRLVPALVLMLTGFAAVALVRDGSAYGGTVSLSVLMALTYTTDVPVLVARAAPEVGHLWTLAVEEQFYVLWPLLLMAWQRRGARLRRLVALVLALYCLLLLGVLAVETPRDAYILPTSWAIVLLLGASARLYRDRLLGLVPRRRKARAASSFIALGVLLTIAAAPALKSWLVTYLVLGPLIGVSTVVLILHLRNWTTVSSRFLRPLLWLGTVSYAAYLWNGLVAVWLGGPAMTMPWWKSLLSVVLTLLAAQVSLVAVERPARRLKSSAHASAGAGRRLARDPAAHGGRKAAQTTPIRDGANHRLAAPVGVAAGRRRLTR